MDSTKIQVLEGDLGGDSIYINTEWGEQLSFCVDFVPPENRQWLGEVIQHQVNQIIMRQRHDAIEGHKRLFNQMLAPLSLRGYEDQTKK